MRRASAPRGADVVTRCKPTLDSHLNDLDPVAVWTTAVRAISKTGGGAGRPSLSDAAGRACGPGRPRGADVALPWGPAPTPLRYRWAPLGGCSRRSASRRRCRTHRTISAVHPTSTAAPAANVSRSGTPRRDATNAPAESRAVLKLNQRGNGGFAALAMRSNLLGEESSRQSNTRPAEHPRRWVRTGLVGATRRSFATSASGRPRALDHRPTAFRSRLVDTVVVVWT
jgi:hypothetical protein